MNETVPVEIQIRGRVKRGRFRELATATIQVSSDKPLADALGEALGEVADRMRSSDD